VVVESVKFPEFSACFLHNSDFESFAVITLIVIKMLLVKNIYLPIAMLVKDAQQLI